LGDEEGWFMATRNSGGNMPIFRKLTTMWRQRKIYITFADMPNGRLASLGLSAVVVTAVFGPLLQCWPEYLRTASMPGAFGSLRVAATGVGLGLFLLAMSFVVWVYGTIAWRCQSLLRERLFR
jgi:hypothetical protein